MRFIQLSEDMGRQILKLLLVLSYSPKIDEKPKAKILDEKNSLRNKAAQVGNFPFRTKASCDLAASDIR